MPEPTGTIILSLGKALVDLLKAQAGFAEGDIVLKSPIEADQAGKISLFLTKCRRTRTYAIESLNRSVTMACGRVRSLSTFAIW